MATVSSTIARALRLIAVIDAQEDVNPKDSQTAIEALNAMMARIEANGLALGWAPVSNPSDDLPVPVEAEQFVPYALALILAPEYGVEPPLAVAQFADMGLRELQRDRFVAEPIIQAPVVPQNRATQAGFNIYSGNYN